MIILPEMSAHNPENSKYLKSTNTLGKAMKQSENAAYQAVIFHANAYFFSTQVPHIHKKKKLEWLVSISAAISFFYLSTMKPLLWHMNNMP